jgi:hypothetical protein
MFHPERAIIQGDQKVSVHLMITIQKVTSNVQSVPCPLQTLIDTTNGVIEDRVQYSTVHAQNIFCASHLQIINYVGIVFFGTVIIRCTETF